LSAQRAERERVGEADERERERDRRRRRSVGWNAGVCFILLVLSILRMKSQTDGKEIR
jgi:hypothetical protein